MNNYNIDIYQGDKFSLGITVKDDSGVPMNLSGYNIRGTLKEKLSDSFPLVYLNCSFTNANSGALNLSLPSQVTSVLPASQLLYDVEVYTSNDDDAFKILKGYANVFPEVTRETQSNESDIDLSETNLTPTALLNIVDLTISGPEEMVGKSIEFKSLAPKLVRLNVPNTTSILQNFYDPPYFGGKIDLNSFLLLEEAYFPALAYIDNKLLVSSPLLRVLELPLLEAINSTLSIKGTSLTSISLPHLSRVSLFYTEDNFLGIKGSGLFIRNNNLLTSVNLSALPLNRIGQILTITNNPLLTTLTFNPTQSLDIHMDEMNLFGNALNQASVNALIIAANGCNIPEVDVSGGTNAAPTGTALAICNNRNEYNLHYVHN